MILLSRSEEIILLAVWKLGKDAYGVTIRERVSAETGHDWSFGAVYKPLKQLTHKDFVKKRRTGPVAARGGRSKFIYELTPAGMDALRELRQVHNAVWTDAAVTEFDP